MSGCTTNLSDFESPNLQKRLESENEPFVFIPLSFMLDPAQICKTYLQTSHVELTHAAPPNCWHPPLFTMHSVLVPGGAGVYPRDFTIEMRISVHAMLSCLCANYAVRCR